MWHEFEKALESFLLAHFRNRLFCPNNAVFLFPKARIFPGSILKPTFSGTTNYRAACRARSHADFIAKMGIVEEECDESLYWMEMLVDSELIALEKVRELMKEGNEILAIIISSRKTAKSHSLARRKYFRSPSEATEREPNSDNSSSVVNCHSPFGIQHLSFAIWQSSFGIRQSPLGALQSTFSYPQSDHPFGSTSFSV
jgi:four helix bundle protein